MQLKYSIFSRNTTSLRKDRRMRAPYNLTALSFPQAFTFMALRTGAVIACLASSCGATNYPCDKSYGEPGSLTTKEQCKIDFPSTQCYGSWKGGGPQDGNCHICGDFPRPNCKPNIAKQNKEVNWLVGELSCQCF